MTAVDRTCIAALVALVIALGLFMHSLAQPHVSSDPVKVQQRCLAALHC